ncbi:MAG: ferrous iron transport protein B [Flavobacteriales bacterium]|nr:ferrous iron transport protein B [Flavobacteriales bacterium]
MEEKQEPKLVALAGVPNVGKTTIFNQLTGLNQKVGNYPGITVDKVTGKLTVKGSKVELVDLPGTYNIFPRSEDERVVARVLCGLQPKTQVDAVLVVADMSNLERGLFLTTQIIDLGYPTALVLNMADQAEKDGLKINKTLLERYLGIPVIATVADKRVGMDSVKSLLSSGDFKVGKPLLQPTDLADSEFIDKIVEITGQSNPFRALQIMKFIGKERGVERELKDRLLSLGDSSKFKPEVAQLEETKLRYQKIREILSKCVKSEAQQEKVNYTKKIDKVLLHPIWGMVIFLGLLFLVFQAVFAWAEAPMNAIDQAFAWLSHTTANALPPGALTDLVSQGIIPGLGGIVIFVPQIALLFAFLALLEASGYMARAVFITDRIMRPFGLNGRSVVPLISGFACAIPAIMATRSIANKKDRLITIFVTPFMSCSARLPVYIVLVGLLFDANTNFFNSAGTAMFFLYILGIVAALASAWAMKVLMKNEPSGGLVLELPRYKWPVPKSVLLTMYEKSKAFVFEAGKVILLISIVLWVLASYGPSDEMAAAEASVEVPEVKTAENLAEYEYQVSAKKLESSYAGLFGKSLEPVLKPLGFDWKIGIALVCSFAAREVFVSTVATLYSIGDDDEDMQTLQEMMAKERNSEGGKMFTPAVVWSLLIFYAFAMQCMSTLAVVYKETKSWKWPTAMLVYMTALAYLASFLAYQILS